MLDSDELANDSELDLFVRALFAGAIDDVN